MIEEKTNDFGDSKKSPLNMTETGKAAVDDALQKIQEEEYAEQASAQIAALACFIPEDAITEGITNAIQYFRVHRKTKKEWNDERVRDISVCKKEAPKDNKAAENAAALEELHGAVSYSNSVEVDADPYIRNYEYNSYELALKYTNMKLANFGSMRVLDFSGQLLGDSKAIELFAKLRRCPIHVLNMSNNKVSDESLKTLAHYLRSLPHLTDLLLSNNLISDAGVEMIFSKNSFSPTLKKVDLSLNSLSTKSAFALGRMFQADIKGAQLDSLFLGGRIGKKGWGDEFVRILVDMLSRPNTRKLKRLSFPSGHLGETGISSIAALVACSEGLEYLNLSKNSLREPHSRHFFKEALRLNKSITELQIGQGGISRKDRDALHFACYSKFQVTWLERCDLAHQVTRELNKCHEMGYAIELVITNNWQMQKPEEFVEFNSTNLPEPERSDEDIPIFDIPFEILILRMKLSYVIVRSLHDCDHYFSQIRTLEHLQRDLDNFISTNITKFQPPREFQEQLKKLGQRKDTCVSCKENIVTLLEKFTSTAIVKTRNNESEDTGGAKKRKKKKKKKGKKSDGDKGGGGGGWTGVKSKTMKINVEGINFTIEEYRSNLLEYMSTIQVVIGMQYQIRLKHLDHLAKMERDAMRAQMYSKKSMIAAKKITSRMDNEASIPHLATLGKAAVYSTYLHIAGPSEEDRIKKLKEKEEIERNRQLQIEAKQKQKANKTRRKGMKLMVTKRSQEEIDFDNAEREDMEQREQERLKEEQEEAARKVLEQQKLEEGESEEDDGSGDSGDSESESEESEVASSAAGDVKREPTRFTVPKREMQKKYEAIYAEDILQDKTVLKSAVSVLSRQSRRHVISALPLPGTFPSYRGAEDVSVELMFEVEEDRCESLAPLSRLDTIRPQISAEDRCRAKKAMHKYVRESALSS